MDKIELETRDRRNIYKEGAENVVAFEIDSEQIEDSDLEEQIGEELFVLRDSVINGRGERFAYLVIKVVRG